jgi:hypothetical protein
MTVRPAALLVSAVAHGTLFWALMAVQGEEEIDDEPFAVEIDVAPLPPEAFDPPARQEPQAQRAPEARSDEVAVAEPEPEPEPEPDPSAAVIDAGVDAAPIPESDAGPLIAGADAGTAELAGVAGGEGDAGVSEASQPAGAKGPVGVGVDLAPLSPPGDHLAVLIRFDRLRGTDWAPRAEKVLAPMPDYRMIIGNRKLAISDQLDALLISSSDPMDVAATNLAGRTTLEGAALRALLNHSEAPVTWSPARGGALGAIGRSPHRTPTDQRVYLTPMDRWVVLVDRDHLGPLADPGGGGLDERPPRNRLPSWLRGLPGLFALTGSGPRAEDGPALAVSVRGLPEAIEIPLVGALPAPRHLTLALEVQPLGFVVRGTMTFANAERAERFVTTANATRSSLVGSPLSATALKRFHAYHGIRGLSLRRAANRVSLATSISIADARALLDIAADQTTQWYARRRR